ncbi:MAG TPA: L,D-transpeptidase family protein [Kofleriaceae bacterium]
MKALVVIAALCSAAAADPIPKDASQLVTGVIDDWQGHTATLRLWERAGGAWKPVGAPWQAAIGSGAGWGIGLHGSGAPSGHDGPVKEEGDGRSPAGAFRVNAAYGYAAGKSLLPFTVSEGLECVDDEKSKNYGTILRRTATSDWHSSEQMRRKDALYTWVIDIAHNPKHQPGAGSCIFFHVWRRADSPTVGCTAMAEPDMRRLLGALKPDAVYVLLPKRDYDALAGAWGLPPR